MSTLNVYLNPYSSLDGQDLYAQSHDALAAGLWYSDGKHVPDDWTLVGTAEVQITLMPRSEVVSAKVENLREQQAKIRADAELKANRIEQQIQQLLCIENGVVA